MNSRQKIKKRIKDYVAQIKYVESIFEAEMGKPVDIRDDELLVECLETLEFLHERKDALLSQENVERVANSMRVPLRSRSAVAACVLIAILITSGIAQALGFRIWSALIHWDAGYLSVNYVPADQQELYVPERGDEDALVIEEENNVFIEYTSIDDAVSELKISPMLPTNLPEPFEVVSVIAQRNTQFAELFVTYKNQSHTLKYEVVAYYDPETVVAITLPDSTRDYEVYENNGITFTYSKNDNNTYATWTSGNCIYNINTDIPHQDVINILDSLDLY